MFLKYSTSNLNKLFCPHLASQRFLVVIDEYIGVENLKFFETDFKISSLINLSESIRLILLEIFVICFDLH